MPRDYKQENKDLKVQRAELWKKVAELEEKSDKDRKSVGKWQKRYYDLKKKIYNLSFITPSELGSDVE